MHGWIKTIRRAKSYLHAYDNKYQYFVTNQQSLMKKEKKRATTNKSQIKEKKEKNTYIISSPRSMANCYYYY